MMPSFVFNIFFPIFTIMFITIFGFFIYGVIKSIQQNAKNKASPVLSVEAKVVSKRMDVSHHTTSNQNMDHSSFSSSSSYYYATFQVESGDRIELRLSGKEYGMLVEGDLGKLTFQGSRYLDFKRNL